MKTDEISNNAPTPCQVVQRTSTLSQDFWRRSSFWVALTCVMALVALSGTSCKSKSGSREFIPGKGWIEN